MAVDARGLALAQRQLPRPQRASRAARTSGADHVQCSRSGLVVRELPNLARHSWHSVAVSFSDYVSTVPAIVRLLLSIVVFVTISVALSWAFYSRSLRLAQEPETRDPDSSLVIPKPSNFVDRILQMTMFGFVFLLAFMLGQFWFNVRTSDESNTTLAVQYGSSVGAARILPPEAGGDIMMQALADYRTAILDEAWPLMVQADAQGAIQVQKRAAAQLLDAEAQAYRAGVSEQPAWGPTQSSISDMLAATADLIVSAPGMGVTAALLMLYFLGITNLALTSLFLVTRKRFYLLGVGIMATITAVLLFVVTDLSNPFIGPHAVIPDLIAVPGFS